MRNATGPARSYRNSATQICRFHSPVAAEPLHLRPHHRLDVASEVGDDERIEEDAGDLVAVRIDGDVDISGRID